MVLHTKKLGVCNRITSINNILDKNMTTRETITDFKIAAVQIRSSYISGRDRYEIPMSNFILSWSSSSIFDNRQTHICWHLPTPKFNCSLSPILRCHYFRFWQLPFWNRALVLVGLLFFELVDRENNIVNRCNFVSICLPPTSYHIVSSGW